MIITLCGSARFEKEFHAWNEVLTLSGHAVFGLAVYPSLKKDNKDWYTHREKIELDNAHLKKIRASDAILVINKFAYIGESTLNEIEFAKNCKKKLYALESWGKGLGICSAHYKNVQEKAEELGVLGTYSPIDTFYPNFKDPWSLLPEAGEYRNSLVNKVSEEEK